MLVYLYSKLVTKRVSSIFWQREQHNNNVIKQCTSSHTLHDLHFLWTIVLTSLICRYLFSTRVSRTLTCEWRQNLKLSRAKEDYLTTITSITQFMETPRAARLHMKSLVNDGIPSQCQRKLTQLDISCLPLLSSHKFNPTIKLITTSECVFYLHWSLYVQFQWCSPLHSLFLDPTLHATIETSITSRRPTPLHLWSAPSISVWTIHPNPKIGRNDRGFEEGCFNIWNICSADSREAADGLQSECWNLLEMSRAIIFVMGWFDMFQEQGSSHWSPRHRWWSPFPLYHSTPRDSVSQPSAVESFDLFSEFSESPIHITIHLIHSQPSNRWAHLP